MLKKLLLATLLLSSLGCATPVLADAADATSKLDQAYELLTVYRYVPARRLIDEAIAIYKERGDVDGLAYAYTVSTDYYRFLSSDAYKKYFQNYSSSLATVKPIPAYAIFGPPRSEQARTESKLAVDTYHQAIANAIASKDHFKASHNYFRLFVHYARSLDDPQECKALDGTIEQHKLGLAIKPDEKVVFDSSKYKSFIEEIEATKANVKCERFEK